MGGSVRSVVRADEFPFRKIQVTLVNALVLSVMFRGQPEVSIHAYQREAGDADLLAAVAQEHRAGGRRGAASYLQPHPHIGGEEKAGSLHSPTLVTPPGFGLGLGTSDLARPQQPHVHDRQGNPCHVML